MNGPYQHKKFRPARIVSALLRGIGYLIEKLPLVLLIVCVVSPVGPHLRIQYRYHANYGDKYITDCVLLGSRGYVERVGNERCPLIAIIDTRQ